MTISAISVVKVLVAYDSTLLVLGYRTSKPGIYHQVLKHFDANGKFLSQFNFEEKVYEMSMVTPCKVIVPLPESNFVLLIDFAKREYQKYPFTFLERAYVVQVIWFRFSKRICLVEEEKREGDGFSEKAVQNLVRLTYFDSNDFNKPEGQAQFKIER